MHQTWSDVGCLSIRLHLPDHRDLWELYDCVWSTHHNFGHLYHMPGPQKFTACEFCTHLLCCGSARPTAFPNRSPTSVTHPLCYGTWVTRPRLRGKGVSIRPLVQCPQVVQINIIVMLKMNLTWQRNWFQGCTQKCLNVYTQNLSTIQPVNDFFKQIRNIYS